jgi:hypothetical protein
MTRLSGSLAAAAAAVAAANQAEFAATYLLHSSRFSHLLTFVQLTAAAARSEASIMSEDELQQKAQSSGIYKPLPEGYIRILHLQPAKT